MAADVDVEGLGLLDGLEGRGRQERADLIAWLLDAGFDVDQIRGSFNPMLLPPNRVMGDDGTLASAQEVSEQSGVSVDLLQQLHRAAGLARVDGPDSPVHSRADAESVLGAAALVDLGNDPQQVVLIVRLLMQGLAPAALMMRQTALHTLLRPGATERELAEAGEVLARRVRPLLGPMIDDLFRLALRHQFETEAISVTERAAGTLASARDVAVAFADLVGFTRLGETLAPEDLGLVAERLTELAHGITAPPVQFVKTIGDAVMFVSPEPAALLRAVLDLIDAVAAEHLPRLRVGIAFGPAASRGGDWYGSTVNLASRLTDAAIAGEVLVEESVRQAMGVEEGMVWSVGAERHLKGISGAVRLCSVHRGGR